jgi:O-acetylhomoserine/O-acetylserine sulfhydrylase-like pyridoxal-dependent enzyme
VLVFVKWTSLPVFLKKFNIGVKWVKTDDPEEFRKAIDEKTKAVYIESIGNPKYNVPNIAEIAKVKDHLRILPPESRLTEDFRSLTKRIYP